MSARPRRRSGEFADHFGARARLYVEARPHYPQALFHFLAMTSGRRRQAWDCATGNGQAAVALADRFCAVLATDASDQMIAQATPHPRVRYAVTRCQTGLADASVDLVTVAQALHWLDLDAFLREARRVAAPGGVLAAWCYAKCRVNATVDPVLDHFHDIILGPYWPAERRHVEDGYRAIALPIDEIPAPPMDMVEEWSLRHLIGYIRTWSGVAKLTEARGQEPLAEFEAALATAWGAPDIRRRVRWPLHFRVGQIR